MTVTVQPSAFSGKVSAPGSKSDLHRLLICAALADRPTVIHGVSRSEDIDATAGCLERLGAEVVFSDGECRVSPGKPAGELPSLNCCESGSTLRFLMPVAAALCGGASFRGAGRLAQRPIAELIETMRSGGVEFDAESLPLSERGRPRPGVYRIAGGVSSQYISGLLMALSIVPGESQIELTSPLQSAPYVAMTLRTLRLFGADVRETPSGYAVAGRERLAYPGEVRP